MIIDLFIILSVIDLAAMGKEVNQILLRIKQERKAKKLSQEYVSTSLGLKQNTYHYYEKGTIRIDLETFFKLAKLLGQDACYLMGCKRPDDKSFKAELAVFEEREANMRREIENLQSLVEAKEQIIALMREG